MTWTHGDHPLTGQSARFSGSFGVTNVYPVAAITYVAEIKAGAPLPSPPRARGVLDLGVKRRDAASAIASLRQEGSLKALFPQMRDDALQAVFLNTAGGLTGGDAMRIAVSVAPDASVTLSSQAAERAYRAQPGQVARMDVALRLEGDARLNWLPQETIVFDGAALDRRLQVDLTGNARALIVEPLILGRAAMGEVVQNLHFTDQWRIFRDGRLVFADAVRLTDITLPALPGAALTGGAQAVATVLLAGPDAAGFADLDLPPQAASSLIADGLLLVRVLAPDGFALRKVLVPLIETLSQAPIPRVWRL